MVGKIYIPERGDIVWLDFNPQAGQEQKGRRPALTISFKAYNERVGLALFCPITSKIKGYPFEVQIGSEKLQGSILSDQIKSMDWRERHASFIEKIEDKKLDEVISKIEVLIK